MAKEQASFAHHGSARASLTHLPVQLLECQHFKTMHSAWFVGDRLVAGACQSTQRAPGWSKVHDLRIVNQEAWMNS